MWKAGTPVTLTASDVAQKLTTGTGLVKAVRLYHHWDNTHRITSGDSTLNTVPVSGPPVGVTGWAPPPEPGNPVVPYIDAYEHQSLNGIWPDAIYVSGQANEVILWSYIEQ